MRKKLPVGLEVWKKIVSTLLDWNGYLGCNLRWSVSFCEIMIGVNLID